MLLFLETNNNKKLDRYSSDEKKTQPRNSSIMLFFLETNNNKKFDKYANQKNDNITTINQSALLIFF